MDILYKLSIFFSALSVILKLAYNKLRERQSILNYINANSIEYVLIVTAHPDDECMFFGPVVRALAGLGCSIQLLCLSKGLGPGREKELQESCRIMGIAECTCIDDKNLVDGMNEIWNEDVVKEHVLVVLNKHIIDLIITFDAYGVSGHANHAAVSKGTIAAWQRFNKRSTRLIQLESVYLWRKYLGFVNYAIDVLRNEIIAVPLPYEAYWIVKEAMTKHASQLLWFRKLYLIFSRYVYLNSFVSCEKK